MIKVNLLRSRGTVTDVNTEMDFDAGTQLGSTSKGGSSESVTKLVIIILGAGLLFGYETYNVGQLKARNAALRGQLAQIEGQISQNQNAIQEAEKLQNEMTQLENRVSSIKDLSRNRLREIKSIDFLQNIIPDRIWLTGLEFKSELLTIRGTSASDDALNEMIERMEAWSGFENVILLQAVDERTRTGTLKNFIVSTSVKLGE